MADPFLYAGEQINIIVQILCKQFAELFVGGERQVFQNRAFLNALGNQLAGDLIGASEGHALLYQIVSQVSSVDETALCCFLHVFGNGLHGCQHRCEDLQTHDRGLNCVKHRFLILLHILVIGKGKTLQSGEQCNQIAVDTAGLASAQLCHIGVFLLRHNGRAGGVGIAELNELEFPAGPQNDLFTEAAHVHHQDAESAHQFYTEVPIGNAVDGVHGDAVKTQLLGFKFPVGIVGGTGQCAATDGGDVHALAAISQTVQISQQHHGVSHQVMGEEDGLGSLQMGVAGHDHGLVGFCLQQDRFDHILDQCGDLINLRS